MLISKLRDNDSFGLVVFNNKAHTIIKPIYKKELNDKIYDLLD
jgi:hypothetical protein